MRKPLHDRLMNIVVVPAALLGVILFAVGGPFGLTGLWWAGIILIVLSVFAGIGVTFLWAKNTPVTDDVR